METQHARIAVDCIITLALFQAVPWLEIQITRAALAELGERRRRSCIAGVAVRLTREQAEREGWPWPSLDDVLRRMNEVEHDRGSVSPQSVVQGMIATQREQGGAR